jgi:Putative peptidoglycan binding domain/L,D-transpeptidase catalytic domain
MKLTNRLARVIATGLGVAAAGLALAGAFATGTAATAGASTATARAPVATIASVTAAYTAPARTLRYGMKGSDVAMLQQRLAALKYYPGAADGQFGAYTLEAVWAFQEVQGLPVDGTVGAKTGAALVHPRAYVARYPSGGSTRVEVNLETRVLVLFRSNTVALISHVSAGGGYYFCNPGGGCGYAITPKGHFRTTVYMPGWITVPLGTMYNSVFFIGRSYAIHGESTSGPTGGGVPLSPVSHGCVRIPFDIAQFFHTLVPTPGTSVYVY